MSVAVAVGLVVLAVGSLLLLVLVVRLHALPSLLVASLLVATAGGIPLQDIAGEVQQAMGGTLGYISLVIGLGAIFGEMLERSGAARRIAVTLLERSGEKGAPGAFAATGLVVAIPVFFDVAFILLLPLLFHTARRTGRTVLLYALPLLAGLAVAHAFVPPTPGPVAVAGLVGADLGWVIVFGLAAGIPALILGGFVFGLPAARRIEESSSMPPDTSAVDVEMDVEVESAVRMPGFSLSIGLVLLPLGLIVLSTASAVLPLGGARPVLQFLGHPFSALLLTLLVASWLLGRRCGWSRDDLREMANRSLQPVGLILLVTGAGGVLGKVLLATGAGSTLAGALDESGLPIFVFAFFLALVVRIAQGSATVSMVTAAGLVAPVLDAAPLSAPSLGLLTVSIAAGATAFSHVNDSGFWLVSKYLHLTEPQTLLTWTPLTAVVGFTGLAVVLLLAPFVAGTATADESVTPTELTSTTDSSAWLEIHDPEFDAIVEGAEIEVLGTGYTWSEGPVWVEDGSFLLFSDVPEDTIYRWSEEGGVEPWVRPSGLTQGGPRSREPGANGLVIDDVGRLVLCQHGDRRVARLTVPPKDGPWIDGDDGNQVAPFETLADANDGHRFHSPNDLVIHPSGDVYFTDPPYGLAGGTDSDLRELDHHGIYRLRRDGAVELLYAGLTRPNGIILSPDGMMLYVAQSDPERAIWMAWDIAADGSVDGGRVFFDATDQVSDERPGLPDGMAIDQQGRLFATGPGGVWVFAPGGQHLGTLRMDAASANCTFGDDGRSLFVTSNDRLLRIRLNTVGLGFPAP